MAMAIDMLELREDSKQGYSCLGFLSFCTEDSNEECCILHEKIQECEVDGLATTWNINSENFNCLQLECQHKFHVSCIAIHFLTNSMRCPVCREGCDSQMSLTSLPESVRASFEKKMMSIPSPQQDEIGRTIHVHLDESAINRDWILMANVLFQHPCSLTSSSIIPTRIQCFDNENMPSFIADALRVNFKQFRLQNHFSRNLNLALHNTPRRRVLSLNFMLYHPLLINVDFTSIPLAVEQLPRDATEFVALKFGDLIGGYISPTTQSDTDPFRDCYRPTPYQVTLNMDILLQCISAQIHDNFQQLSMRLGM